MTAYIPDSECRRKSRFPAWPRTAVPGPQARRGFPTSRCGFPETSRASGVHRSEATYLNAEQAELREARYIFDPVDLVVAQVKRTEVGLVVEILDFLDAIVAQVKQLQVYERLEALNLLDIVVQKMYALQLDEIGEA